MSLLNEVYQNCMKQQLTKKQKLQAEKDFRSWLQYAISSNDVTEGIRKATNTTLSIEAFQRKLMKQIKFQDQIIKAWNEEMKLDTLLEVEGLTEEELMKNSVTDSMVPGICMNPDCDYTNYVEADQREGVCENCGTNTVQSALVIMDVI